MKHCLTTIEHKCLLTWYNAKGSGHVLSQKIVYCKMRTFCRDKVSPKLKRPGLVLTNQAMYGDLTIFVWLTKYLCPPPPGARGSSTFTVVSRPHPSASASTSVSEFVYAIFPAVFADGFQILRHGEHGQDLEMINFL